MRRTLLIMILVVPVGFAVSASAATRMTANCFWPPQHFACTQIMTDWAEKVSAVTDGRVQVNVLPISIAPAGDQLSSVRAGSADVAYQYIGLIARQAPSAMVAMMPFMGQSDPVARSIALWRTYEKYGLPDKEFKGVKLLSMFVIPGTDFWSTTTPIENIDDLRDRTLYAVAGIPAATMKLIGVPIESGPAVGITEYVQRGVVDGYVGTSSVTSRLTSLVRYTKSTTRTDKKLYTPAFTLVINEDTWSGISKEDQEKIMSVSGEAFASAAADQWQEENKAAQQNEDKKMKVIHASEQFEKKLQSLSRPVVQKWIDTVSDEGGQPNEEIEYFKKQVEEVMARKQ